MKIEQDLKLDYDDVLIKPKHGTVCSRKNVELRRTFKFYHSSKTWTGVPIICSNMSFSGLRVAKVFAINRMVCCLHKFHTPDSIKKFYQESAGKEYAIRDYVWPTVGWNDDAATYLKEVGGNESINFCVDVANAHIEQFVQYCGELRKLFPSSIIMAGNVATYDAAKQLILYGGIDIAKVGTGPSQICDTRIVTGVGMPQLSACIECGDVHGLKNGDKKLGLICADGGIKQPGDFCKSFCAGADFVMAGSIFAAHEECDSEVDAAGNILHYGMSSHHAQKKHLGGIQSHRPSEGNVRAIKQKGPLQETINQILGGLRSCGTYIGAGTLKDFGKCATFVRVNRIK